MAHLKSKLSNIFKSKQTIAAGAIWITAFTLGSKLLGLVRQMITSSLFGTSRGFDAVVIAQQPAAFLSMIISSSFASIAIPMYLEEKKKNGDESAKFFARSLVGFISIFLLVFGAMLFLFPDLFVKIFAPKFPQKTFLLADSYLRIFSILPFFTGLINVFGTFLRAERMFLQYSLASFTFNLVAIPVLLLLTSKIGAASYAVAWTAGTASMAFVAYLFGKKIWTFFPFSKPFTRQMVRALYLAAPLFLSITVGTINSIVDKSFAAYLPVGSVSALTYSFSIITMISGLASTGLITSSFTSVSESAAMMDDKALERKTRILNETVIKMLSPIAAFTIVAASWIVEIIYQRGAFNVNSTAITSTTLVGYSIMILTIPLNSMLGNVYMAKKSTLRLSLLSIPFILLNAIMDWWLMSPFKQAGIAASSSVVGILWMLTLTVDLKYHYKIFHLFSVKTILPVLTSILYVYVFLFHLHHIPEYPKLILEFFIASVMVLFFARNEFKMVVRNVGKR
ncbi:murein biosynthesis integral membrane protein MurJ [Mesoaciditoga sp.]